jgi:hypothetical protein
MDYDGGQHVIVKAHLNDELISDASIMLNITLLKVMQLCIIRNCSNQLEYWNNVLNFKTLQHRSRSEEELNYLFVKVSLACQNFSQSTKTIVPKLSSKITLSKVLTATYM